MTTTTTSAPELDEVYAPVPLEQAPEVTALLARLGLGQLVAEQVKAPIGRNDVWAGPTTTGAQVLVKRLTGHPVDVRARMRRLLSFEEVNRSGSVRSPHVLGFDEAAGVVAFTYLSAATSGAKAMMDETFAPEDCRRLGSLVATLHGLPVAAGCAVDTSAVALPSLPNLQALDLVTYENLSHAEIEAWRLQQTDRELVDALVALTRDEGAAPRVPAHCDLRVDQVLFDGGRPVLADWEEFRLADGARDVGSFVGEWLYRSILDIVTTRGEDDHQEIHVDHATVLRRGGEKIARLRPQVVAFWSAYVATRGGTDEDFVRRTTAFAGWHMLDRLIAGAGMRGRLVAIERAAAGIGRGVLLAPDRFAATLGIGVSR